MRRFRHSVFCAILCNSVSSAAVVFDAPGHAALEGAPIAARGGKPGLAWRLVDWRNREVEGAAGVFDERGEAALPPLPAGYYAMVSDDAATTPPPPSPLATLAVVAEGAHPDARAPSRAFAADAALSSISRHGAFQCPWNGGDTERTVADLLALCGFRHVRDRLHWRHVQPSPDAPPDFGRYLANARMLRERGIGVSGMFHDCPAWARPRRRLPGDPRALYDFCRASATAFGDCADDWEFWNEPDLAFAPEPVWEYASLLKVASLAFRSVRPDIPVLNGGLSIPPYNSPYYEALLENDVLPYLDAFNYHTYAPISKYPQTFAKLRADLAAAGAPDIPIWVTEFGTDMEGLPESDGAMAGRKAHSPEQELLVAEFYPKAAIALQSEGVERSFFFVFAAYNERGGRKDWGVIRRDGTVKPVFSAMATLLREIGDARILGALAAPDGIRACLYEHPDGSQTVVFWSESPLDAAAGGVVAATPDFAREWSLAPPRGISFRLVDMCGGVSEVAPAPDGSLRLAATRFPAYLAIPGGGLSPAASLSCAPRAAAKRRHCNTPLVPRILLDPRDFEISGRKTLAVMKGDAGRATVELWNFSDTAQTGMLETAGAAVSGLPTAPFEVPPFPNGPAAFECTLAPKTNDQPSDTLVLSGAFEGRPISRLAVPLLFDNAFTATCRKVELPWQDPALWKTNSSADAHSISFDAAGGFLRFDASWESAAADRWMYPERALALPDESLSEALRIEFEIRSEQDKVENDFKSQYLMLVFGDGRPDLFIPFDPPTGDWERRRVDLPPGMDAASVSAIRVGANPHGTRCTLFLKNLTLLKSAK